MPSSSHSALVEGGRGVSSTEQSPLLAPASAEGTQDHSFTIDVPAESYSSNAPLLTGPASKPETSKSTLYLILLTLSIGGLQLAWAVELSNGSPLLLNLGISKSTLAVVWLAGPISGVLVHPYIGMKSDRHRSRFGRRRPFMVGGAIATILSLLALAWNGEIIGTAFSVLNLASATPTEDAARIVFAILMVYVLDFSINAIQAAIRAFIVDNAPTHQQDAANAWASRLTGAGNIILYLVGYLDLPKILWFIGNTQFKVLCVVASLGLIATLAVSCATISEVDSRARDLPVDARTGYFTVFKDIFSAVRHLPSPVKRVCTVQLAAWIGWFPFLFYTTTYVGQIYVNQTFKDAANVTHEEFTKAWEEGTRLGAYALSIYAIVFLSTSIILPWFIDNAAQHSPLPPQSPTSISEAYTHRTAVRNDTISGTGRARQILQAFSRFRSSFSTSQTHIRSLVIPGLTLRRAWLLSHVMFAVLSCLTFFVHSTTAATVLIAFFGIPWALTMWAPFALIAAEVSRREEMAQTPAHADDINPRVSQTGVILGIHNVSIAAPQIVASLLSSVIFSALQKQRDAVGDESVAWVLRLGGLAALLAAFLTTRVQEEVRS